MLCGHGMGYLTATLRLHPASHTVVRRVLLSLANYTDMARVQIVGARHAVPGFQGHAISRASVG